MEVEPDCYDVHSSSSIEGPVNFLTRFATINFEYTHRENVTTCRAIYSHNLSDIATGVGSCPGYELDSSHRAAGSARRDLLKQYCVRHYVCSHLGTPVFTYNEMVTICRIPGFKKALLDRRCARYFIKLFDTFGMNWGQVILLLSGTLQNFVVSSPSDLCVIFEICKHFCMRSEELPADDIMLCLTRAISWPSVLCDPLAGLTGFQDGGGVFEQIGSMCMNVSEVVSSMLSPCCDSLCEWGRFVRGLVMEISTLRGRFTLHTPDAVNVVDSVCATVSEMLTRAGDAYTQVKADFDVALMRIVQMLVAGVVVAVVANTLGIKAALGIVALVGVAIYGWRYVQNSLDVEAILQAVQDQQPAVVAQAGGISSNGLVGVTAAFLTLVTGKQVVDVMLHSKNVRDASAVCAMAKNGIVPVLDFVLESFKQVMSYFGLRNDILADMPSDIDDLVQFVATFDSARIRTIANDASVVQEIDDHYRKFLSFVSYCSRNHCYPTGCDRNIYQQVCRDMRKLHELSLQSGARGAGYRHEPFVVEVTGPPGIGKSSLLPVIQMELMKILEPDVDPEDCVKNCSKYIYSRASDNEFYDGYTGQPVVFVDDIGQFVDTTANPCTDYVEMVHNVGRTPHMLHMANIAEKSNTFMTSKVILTTSNRAYPKIASMVCPEAYYRRRHLLIVCEVKQNGRLVSKPDFAGSDFDLGCYHFSYRDPKQPGSLPNPIGNFTCLRRFLRNRYVAHNNKETNYSTFLMDHAKSINARPASPGLGTSVASSSLVCTFASVPPAPPLPGVTIAPGGASVSYVPVAAAAPPISGAAAAPVAVATAAVPSTSGAAAVPVAKAQAGDSPFFDCTSVFDAGAWASTFARLQANLAAFAVGVRGWCATMSSTALFRAATVVAGAFGMWKIFATLRGGGASDELTDVDDDVTSPAVSTDDSSGDDISRLVATQALGDTIPRRALGRTRWQEGSIASDVPKADRALSRVNWQDGKGDAHVMDYPRQFVRPLGNSFQFSNGTYRTTASAVRFVEDIFTKNLFALRIVTKDREFSLGVVLFVAGRTALVNSHVWKKVLFHARNGAKISVENINTKFFVVPSELRVTELPSASAYTDVALVEFSKQIPARKDIRKFFIDAANLECVTKKKAIIPVMFVSQGKSVREREILVDCLVPDMTVNVTVTDAARVEQYTFVNCWQYDDCGFEGMCGSPVIVTVRNEPMIVGVHFAGGSGGSYAHKIMRSDLNVINDVGFQCADVPSTLNRAMLSQRGGENLLVFATIKPLHAVVTTALRKTPFGELFDKGVCKPVHLQPFETVDGIVSPRDKALGKYMAPAYQLHEEGLRYAEGQLLSRLGDIDWTPYRTLQYAEAIRGCPEFDIQSINRDSSPGYPWMTIEPGKKKHPWLGKDDVPDIDNAELRSAVKLRLKNASRGKRTACVFVDTLKDELRPIAKVDEGKTRLFSAGPVDFIIAQKMLFGAFTAILNRHWHITGNCVGFNVFGDAFDKIARALLSKGDKLKCGDFKHWDGNVPAQVMHSVWNVVNKILPVKGPLQWCGKTDLCKVRGVLNEELCNSWHVDRDLVYELFKSQPSGNMLTADSNGLQNIIVHLYAYYYLVVMKPESPKLEYCFWNNVSLFVYGDDNISSVSGLVSERYNGDTFSDFVETLGMHYTHMDKTRKADKFTSWDDADFCSRRFVKGDDGAWRGVRDLDNVFTTLCWTKNDNYELLLDVLRYACLPEAALHGKEIYDAWSADVYDKWDEVYGGKIERKTFDDICREMDHDLPVFQSGDWSDCSFCDSQSLLKSFSFLARDVCRHNRWRKCDGEGFVSLDDFRDHYRERGLWLQVCCAKAMVAMPGKKRFEFVAGRGVRALQGHNFDVDLKLDEYVGPDVIYHATYNCHLNSIKRGGICKQKRNHVHLSSVHPNSAVAGSGYRCDADVVLCCSVAIIRLCGHRVYVAKNGVVLTDYVPPTAILKIDSMEAARPVRFQSFCGDNGKVVIHDADEQQGETGFNQDETAPKVEPPKVENLFAASMPRQLEFTDMLTQPVRLFSDEIDASSTMGNHIRTIRLPGDMAVSTGNRPFGRMSCEIILDVVSSRFIRGMLLVVWRPAFEDDWIGLDSGLRGLFNWPHELLDLTSTQVKRIVYPWRAPNFYRNYRADQAMDGCGRVYFYVLVSPTGADDSPTGTCTLTCYGRVCDAHFPGMGEGTVYQSGANAMHDAGPGLDGPSGDTEGAASAGTSITGMVRRVGGVVNKLGTAFPILKVVTKPVAWITDAISSVASIFGFSKPYNESIPMRVIMDPTHFMINSTANIYGNQLAMDTRNRLQSAPGVFGSTEDEMALGHVFGKNGLVCILNWKITDGVGTRLALIPVHPFYGSNVTAKCTVPAGYFGTGDLVVKGKLSVLDCTTMCAVAGAFRFWTGSLIYTFTVIKTNFHIGKAYIAFYPGGTVPIAGSRAKHCQKIVWDIHQKDEVEFRVPYYGESPWRTRYDTVALDPADVILGDLNLIVYSKLYAPETCDPSVDVLVRVRAGPDFRVACPVSNRSVPFDKNNGSEEVWSDEISTTLPHQYADLLPAGFQASGGTAMVDNLRAPTMVREVVGGVERLLPESLCIGEEILSLKQLLLCSTFCRWLHKVRLPFKFNNSPWLRLLYKAKTNKPATSGTAVAAGNGIQFRMADYLNYFGRMYAGWRGSIRHTMIRIGGFSASEPRIYAGLTYNYGPATVQTATLAFSGHTNPRSAAEPDSGILDLLVPYENDRPYTARDCRNEACSAYVQDLHYDETDVESSYHRSAGDDFELGLLIGTRGLVQGNNIVTKDTT